MLENGPLCTFVEPVEKRDGYGSTDVGDVQHIVPCVQVMTATCNLAAPGHSWQITACAGMSIGMKGMLYGAKVMAATAMKLVDDPKLVEQAKEEFQQSMKKARAISAPFPRKFPFPASEITMSSRPAKTGRLSVSKKVAESHFFKDLQGSGAAD